MLCNPHVNEPLDQVRADFLAGEIPELIKHPEDGLGLVVTDILLHLLNHPGEWFCLLAAVL